MSLFSELLQVSLGTRDVLSRTPTEKEWDQFLRQAQKQAIMGVMVDGLERLPQGQWPPKKILFTRWIGPVQQEEITARRHRERAQTLTNIFSEAGFRSCVLKGIGTARLYPNPLRRQSGDIDLWVAPPTGTSSREFPKRLKGFLHRSFEADHIVWHHVGVKIFEDVDTEIHLHPSWVYNPICNRRLQRWFCAQLDAQMKVNKTLGFACPTVEFDAVFSLSHSFRHLLEEGLGLRHIVDYFYILRALPLNSRQETEKTLKSVGLRKYASAMMWVLWVICGMSKDDLLCEPNEREGRFLLDEVSRGGNFGHYRGNSRRRNSFARFIALFPHYPGEMLWMVPWKIWHYGWRLVNR